MVTHVEEGRVLGSTTPILKGGGPLSSPILRVLPYLCLQATLFLHVTTKFDVVTHLEGGNPDVCRNRKYLRHCETRSSADADKPARRV